jgi:F0F1-type ATP synthase assembly protein I
LAACLSNARNMMYFKVIMADLARGAGKLLVPQLLLLAVTSAVFYVRYGGFQAGSVWGGGIIAMAHTLLLEWRRGCADSGRALTGGESLRLLYRTALERFVLVILLFALALGVLQLEPPALIAGFIAGQVALIVTRIYKTE